MQLSYCVKEQKPCVRWVEKYFKDCLCNVKDDFSFGFGLISLVCWGVAEIPQIITNFQTKSGHGVSLAFLLTWVVGFVLSSPPILTNTHAHTHKQEHKKEFLTFFSFSSFYLLFTKRKSLIFGLFYFCCSWCSDIFNLVGCLLEPATVSVRLRKL